jgi:hypothetical protein
MPSSMSHTCRVTIRSSIKRLPRCAGMLPRVMKRTAQTAIIWTLYEELLPALAALSALLSSASTT